jgi:two-component system, chemotaxis family, chemotaxis protein CheY
MAVRVVIVDDHDVFRSRLRELLTVEAFDIVGDAATGAAGLALTARVRPDLVLLDVMLPDGASFDLVPDIQRTGAAVVLISSRDRRDYGTRVDTSGADGFLAKSELSGPAIREALR